MVTRRNYTALLLKLDINSDIFLVKIGSNLGQTLDQVPVKNTPFETPQISGV
jgi:hypothetical protein